jgi:DNA-binding PucR family transcriptional regulator
MGSLEREAIDAAATVGCADPLLISAGATSLWAWCGTYARPTTEALAKIEGHRPTEGVRMAVGRPGYGVDGFRVSHVEAGHASRFWELGAARMGGTTAYRAVEVVSLLAADIDRARRFVASELGPLAEDSDAAARVRSTLLTFLAHGASHTRAAQALHMHHNTVYNRVRRAEELLGAPVSAGSLELQTALLLAETLGADVLL